jgi:hypothetical protein
LMWGKPDQMRAWSPECELAWHRIYFRAQLGSSAVVPCAHTRPLPHIPGAAFAFALGWDPWSYLALSRASRVPHLLSHRSGSWWWSIPTLALPHALPAPRLLGQDPWWWCHVPAHPLSHTPGAVFAQSGSLVVAPCTCLPSAMHSQRHCAPLALSHTLPALCLLGQHPWWWRHVPARPDPHTPGTAFAFALGWDAWW